MKVYNHATYIIYFVLISYLLLSLSYVVGGISVGFSLFSGIESCSFTTGSYRRCPDDDEVILLLSCYDDNNDLHRCLWMGCYCYRKEKIGNSSVSTKCGFSAGL